MSLEQEQSPPSNDDSGLSVLILLLRFHGISVEPKQLLHQYGNTIGTVEILRCAKDLKLKARMIASDWQRLSKTSLPAIAKRKGRQLYYSEQSRRRQRFFS